MKRPIKTLLATLEAIEGMSDTINLLSVGIDIDECREEYSHLLACEGIVDDAMADDDDSEPEPAGGVQ